MTAFRCTADITSFPNNSKSGCFLLKLLNPQLSELSGSASNFLQPAPSLQNLLRLHGDRFDPVTEHDHFPFPPTVSHFAEFKTISAAQYAASVRIACQSQFFSRDSVIQTLQIFSGSGASACFMRDFEDVDAVQPEPAA
jgi:hypothetical protein